MDWTTDEQQVEQALRDLPLVQLAAEKRWQIKQALLAEAERLPRQNRKRKWMLASGASVVAAAVLVAGLYVFQQGQATSQAVQGAKGGPALSEVSYQVPQTLASTNWRAMMVPSTKERVGDKKAPRYDFKFTYLGPGIAEHVVIDGRGVGIWKPTGEVISDLMQAGTLRNGGFSTGYENFAILASAPSVEFTINWDVDGKAHSEHFSFAKEASGSTHTQD